MIILVKWSVLVLIPLQWSWCPGCGGGMGPAWLVEWRISIVSAHPQGQHSLSPFLSLNNTLSFSLFPSLSYSHLLIFFSSFSFVSVSLFSEISFSFSLLLSHTHTLTHTCTHIFIGSIAVLSLSSIAHIFFVSLSACLLHWLCHVQYSTAQYSTAQHSTAQHSTAQHRTVQHSTGQDAFAVSSSVCAVHIKDWRGSCMPLVNLEETSF